MSSYFRLYVALPIFLLLFLVGNLVYFKQETIMPFVQKIIPMSPTTKPVQSISLPTKDELNTMSESDLFDLYHIILQTVTYHCKKIIRAGTVGDGGWNLCADPEFVPKKPCVVYSFGIESDSSFDLAVHNMFGCEVHSFDPTLTKAQEKLISPLLNFHPIGLSDKNQEIEKTSYQTLQEIRKNLGHLKTDLAILKIDIETWEWRSLRHSVDNNMLNDVHQLLIEFHSLKTDMGGHRKDFLDYLHLIRDIQDLGFRAFAIDPYINCQFLTKHKVTHTGCHDIYYVKVT